MVSTPIIAIHQQALDKARKHLTAPDYTSFHPKGFMQAVYCKKCGVAIRGMVPVNPDKPELVTLGVLANYVEVTILCDDGSKHQTNCCIDCSRGLTPQDLEAFLAADTEAFFKEAGMTNQPVSKNLTEMLVLRQPVRVE